MAKTIFQPGTTVTSEFLNALNNPVFDGQDIDGHRSKIGDDELSDTGIKQLVNNLLSGFSVTHSGGTSFNVSSGTFIDKSGQVVSVPETTVTLPSSGIFFVQLDDTGTITYSTAILPIGMPLARVVMTVDSYTLTDLRSVASLKPSINNVRVFGGLGSAKSLRVDDGMTPGWNGDTLVVGSSHNLTGEHYFRDFTVASGSSLVVNGGCRLYCSGNVDIAGVIVVVPTVSGGKGFTGTVLTPSDIFASNGNGIGGGSGHGSGSASPYHYTLSPGGSGGASAYAKVRLQGAFTLANIQETIFLTTGNGGSGGGFFIVECGGTISVSGTIACPGSNAGTPITPTGINLTFNRVLISGAGGGSGGLIWLQSSVGITTTPSCLFDVQGGDGGIGYLSSNIETSFQTEGGGGGSGGWVVLQSPNNNLISFNTNVNTLLSGGAAGNTYGTGTGNTLAGSTGGSYAALGGESGLPGDDGQFVQIPFTPI